eukprot:gb/GFBE01040808.1/.p1 GENE.gb/GFBE01040808.1/~~gb/GFBE01040808.1/.p1  ORF type:complete len:593 (+),score=118.32 gb/GFBE01040808.1/:1-1779(+)
MIQPISQVLAPSGSVDISSGDHAAHYPLQLGLAYLFLGGYLVRTVFVSAGLPSSVGVILVGFVFSFFFQYELLEARDALQELAFFLVLLTAGMEIRLKDLRVYLFVMAFFPATCELITIAAYGVFVLGYSAIEGLVLGTILVAIGDGLVIPKMKEFGFRFQGHPMPRLMFAWAPLEASFALTMFGVLSGFAAPSEGPVHASTLIAFNVGRIVATVGAGAVLGSVSGWLIQNRRKLALNGQQVFTGTPVEGFLMILAVGLAAYGLGSGETGDELVPMPGSVGGSLFQPELMVIMTGVFFAAVVQEKELHEVESVMGGVWIFGQIVLFSMIGSRTTLDIFPEFFDHVFPLLMCGLLARFLGILCAISATIFLQLPGHPFKESMVMQDTVFCFLSTLPRATIQGALGQVPVTQHFFRGELGSSACRDFIFLAARLYIIVMSVCGMILLNTFGPRLCQATLDRPPWGAEPGQNLKKEDAIGHSEKDDRLESAETEVDVEVMLDALSQVYSIPAEVIADALKKAAVQHKSAMPAARRLVRLNTDPARLSRLTAGDRDAANDLNFAQFDCLGSVMNESRRQGTAEWRGHSGRKASTDF